MSGYSYSLQKEIKTSIYKKLAEKYKNNNTSYNIIKVWQWKIVYKFRS